MAEKAKKVKKPTKEEKAKRRRKEMVTAIKATHGNVRQAAKILGITVRTMYFRNDSLKAAGLEPVDFNSYRPAGYKRTKKG